MTQMQGIVSILGSENPEKRTKAASLRRTLSADMSSKNWFADNGLRMKKIASSERISVDMEEGKGEKNPTQVDIWTAIMSQKKQEDSGELPPPYVHPLVKKSASLLSEKSLKICTESLGSETGSDVFSLQPNSDKSGDQQNGVVKLGCVTAKRPQPTRSLPPPLPSLAAARTDGASLHMHSRRVDGRLVVEAVSVQHQKYFEAQRQDGRFLLTLINDPKPQDEIQTDKSPSTVKTIFQKEEESSRSRPTGLPPLPPTTSMNSYDYYWRAKPTVASVIGQHLPPTKTKDLVLVRGNTADCILPSLKGCKEPRRSVLMWEPLFYIATS